MIGYMDKELELELVRKYPKILKEYGGDMRVTCMSFGFQHQNGWLKLVSDGLEKVQYLCDLFTKDNGSEVQLVATTFKEKFGTLRWYETTIGATNLQMEILDNIVSATERKSAHTCEVTGERGELCQRGGWYKTLCYEEARKDGYVACDEGTEAYWKDKDATKAQTASKAE